MSIKPISNILKSKRGPTWRESDFKKTDLFTWSTNEHKAKREVLCSTQVESQSEPEPNIWLVSLIPVKKAFNKMNLWELISSPSSPSFAQSWSCRLHKFEQKLVGAFLYFDGSFFSVHGHNVPKISQKLCSRPKYSQPNILDKNGHGHNISDQDDTWLADKMFPQKGPQGFDLCHFVWSGEIGLNWFSDKMFPWEYPGNFFIMV